MKSSEALKDESNTRSVKGRKKATPVKSREPGRRKLPPQFPTRSIDWSKMVRVQIDVRTWIYVPKGTNTSKAKAEYLDRLRASKSQLTPKKTTVPVSRFKPIK